MRKTRKVAQKGRVNGMAVKTITMPSGVLSGIKAQLDLKSLPSHELEITGL